MLGIMDSDRHSQGRLWYLTGQTVTYKENVEWRLDCTSMLLSDTMSFRVEVIDYDNIDIYSDSYVTKLKRVN